MSHSIFFDFTLPNSATWFYFSLFLTVALFFQFSRLLSLRNWDVLALFLFAPGFLLIQEANQLSAPAPATNAPFGSADQMSEPPPRAAKERLLGYIWLLSASGYWFVRCLIDLAAVKRPLPSPNLTTPGMIWFGCALFGCFAAITFTRPNDPWEPIGRQPVVIAGVEEGATAVMKQTQPEHVETHHVKFAVRKGLAAACHFSIVVALVLIGAIHFQSLATGAAAATLYLLIPYTAYHVGQVHHVWPAALIVWAVFAYRSPTIAGLLLGTAAGTTFFPALLLPAWVQFYRGRGTGRFFSGFAVAGLASLASTLIVVSIAGPVPDAIWPSLEWADWQPWRVPMAESIWTGAHWAYRLPVLIVFAAFVLGSFLWPPTRHLGALCAVSAATLIGVQFWHADRGGLYVLWYAPLLVLLVLRPTTTELQPHPPGPWPRVILGPTRWIGRRFGIGLSRIPQAG